MESIETKGEYINAYVEDLLEMKRKNVHPEPYMQWLSLQELIKIRKLLEARE